MTRVQMLIQVTGGHASGEEWPPPGGFLDTDDREARELVAGGIARPAPDEERAVMPPGDAEKPQDGAEAPDAGEGAPDAEDGSEDDGDDDPSKPRVRDPKETWEAHAVSQGVTAEDAAAMTKADLIATYGSPAA